MNKLTSGRGVHFFNTNGTRIISKFLRDVVLDVFNKSLLNLEPTKIPKSMEFGYAIIKTRSKVGIVQKRVTYVTCYLISRRLQRSNF